MRIKNLTSNTIEVKLKDILARVEFTCLISPFSSTDRDGVILLDQEKLRGIVEVGDGTPLVAINPPTVEETEVVTTEAPIEEKSSEEETRTEEESPVSEFICDICGAEFGSMRGLMAHKNRAHPELINK